MEGQTYNLDSCFRILFCLLYHTYSYLFFMTVIFYLSFWWFFLLVDPVIYCSQSRILHLLKCQGYHRNSLCFHELLYDPTFLQLFTRNARVYRVYWCFTFSDWFFNCKLVKNWDFYVYLLWIWLNSIGFVCIMSLTEVLLWKNYGFTSNSFWFKIYFNFFK